MSAIDILLPFLEEHEGYKDHAYPDPGPTGLPITLGYGTTKIDGKPIQMGTTCTREQAKQWILDELADITRAVGVLVKVPMNDKQTAMIWDFCYNAGLDNFAKSTLLHKLNLGDYVGAANELDKWIYAKGKVLGGLVRRRKEEKEIFLS